MTESSLLQVASEAIFRPAVERRRWWPFVKPSPATLHFEAVSLAGDLASESVIIAVTEGSIAEAWRDLRQGDCVMVEATRLDGKSCEAVHVEVSAIAAYERPKAPPKAKLFTY